MTTSIEAPVPTADPAVRSIVAGRGAGRWSVLLALVGVLLVACVLSIAVGARPIAITRVWDALTSFDPAVEDHLVVRELRIPRTLLGILVGVALGVAGAVMQGLTRNPLADPGLLGINAGAALAVVAGLTFFGVQSTLGLTWFAFGGAAIAGLAVYVLGSVGAGRATPVKLAIVGAAIAALLTSITTAILLIDNVSLDQFRFWAVGSLAGRDLSVVAGAAPFVLAGVVLALVVARGLDGLAMGEDTAVALGQRVALVRILGALAVVLLCGAATAAAGPIVFVGLVVPHLARALTGPDHRRLLAFAAVLGAILLLTADVVGRVVVRPSELEVGVVTAFVGAPVFIAFVRKRRLSEL